MNIINAEHINAMEAKERAERQAQQQLTERATQIGALQRVIAEAERRKTAPIFNSEDAATSYRNMRARVEALAQEYERNLWGARQSAQPYPMNLGDEKAIAYFFGDIIAEKLPALAARICSRDCRGQVGDEAKRAEVVAECDATIADAKARLAALGV